MMFSFLKKYRVVVVCGPQRSGTTIAARAIAHDTGHEYVDEEQYGTKNPVAWEDLVRTGSSLVIQSPAMTFMAHRLADLDDVAVVFMHRNHDHVRRSAGRIEWDGEADEIAKYRKEHGDLPDLPIERLKLHVWLKCQSRQLKHPVSVFYATLAKHSLWVPRGKRENWGKRQWQHED